MTLRESQEENVTFMKTSILVSFNTKIVQIHRFLAFLARICYHNKQRRQVLQ